MWLQTNIEVFHKIEVFLEVGEIICEMLLTVNFNVLFCLFTNFNVCLYTLRRRPLGFA